MMTPAARRHRAESEVLVRNVAPQFASSPALEILAQRFAQTEMLHPKLAWEGVATHFTQNRKALRSLELMEASGGEPTVVLLKDEVLLIDCARQSPAKRRSLCFDRAAREARVKFPPASSAAEEAKRMGVALLDETRYQALQELLPLDTTTSSWLATPERIRSLGGALFAERRYERVFVFANGADAYFSSRGWRGMLHLGPAADLSA